MDLRPSRGAHRSPVETMEARVLLCALPEALQGPHVTDHVSVAAAPAAAAFAVNVNFQPPRTTVPAGYVVDTGATFGDRGNGFTYGWDAANTAYRDRNNTLSPDQRYDTLTHTQLYGTRTWELVVPSGTYSVRLVAGDPSNTNSVYGFDVEGVNVAAGRPTSTSRWVEGTKTVAVSDGRLTVSNSASASNNKLAFIEVTSSDAEPQPPPPVAGWATHAPSPVARFEAGSASIDGRIYVFGGYTKEILAMTRSDVYDPAADRWSPVSDMPEPITHAGVAVDGRAVYFAGGFVGERAYEATDSVWKYDAGTNRWSAVTPLPEPRAAGALVRLGRDLHYFGGTSANLTRDYGDHWVLDLDDVGAGWSDAAPLPNPRNHLAYAALNGKAYAIGGQHLKEERTGAVADVQAYDPATGRWSAVAGLPLARSHVHTATVVMNGRITVFGGLANDPYFPKTISDVSSYDPTLNAWVALPPLLDVRQAAVAQAVGQRVYVIGGTPRGIFPQPQTWSRQMAGTWDVAAPSPVALAEVAGGIIGGKMYLVGAGTGATIAYDIAAGTWGGTTALAQRPYRGDHHAAEVVNGKLYLFGGLGGGSQGKVQIFDPLTNRWSLGADMPFAAGSSSSAVIGGRVYVAGGIVGSATTNRAASYNPVTNAWTEVTPMPQGRNHAASATDGVRLYVFGGRGPGSGDSNMVANGFDTVQIYNPFRNAWFSSAYSTSTLRPLPQARGGMGRAVYPKGEFYVMGGETLTGAGAPLRVYDRVDVYNPITNTWRLATTPLPTARHGIFPLLYAGRVYVAAGGVRAGASSSTLFEVLNLG